jgi:hypothetical protein
MRVLRPAGLLFAAAISRFAALLDLLVRADRLHEPNVLRIVKDAVTTGVFQGSDAGLFTVAYFHRPQELSAEITEVGFDEVKVMQVEGPGFLVTNFEDRWNDPARKEAMLEAARLIEEDLDMLAAASHLVAVARKPA